MNKELTVCEMKDDIEQFIFEQGIDTFLLTETFVKYGRRVFLIADVHIEFEKDVICFVDKYDVLLTNFCVSAGFLKNNLLDACRTKINGIIQWSLHFKDGNILIEGLNY